MYCGRGSILGRINDRRVVPSVAMDLPRPDIPAARLCGPLAMLTGGAIASRSRVSLTRVAGKALAEPPIADAGVPQLCGTDSAPTLTARPTPADTAPPTGAAPTEPNKWPPIC